MLTTHRLLQTVAAALRTPVVRGQDAACPQSSRPSPAPAPPWPTQAVRLLVGFPAGAAPDLAARIIAEPLAGLLGQPVVVENHPGSSGSIAANEVAKAQDGHTIGALINGNLTIAKLLDPKAPFNPETDFAPVSLIGTAPLVLAAYGDAEGASPEELLLWVRTMGNAIRYGTPGVGTVGHLGMELLKSRAGGIRAQHVPFAGNPQVIEAMLSGDIQLALLPPGLAKAPVKAGLLKAIGVAAPQRSPIFPELPTLREVNVNGADLEIWTALAGPASLPPAAIEKLNAALREATRSPDVQQRLLMAGWQASAGTPQSLAYRMRTDTVELGGVILMRGIHAKT